MVSVTSFMNRKGGCAKSSCTFHLGGTFAKLGQRVLLLDLDPQANLTQGFFGRPATKAMPEAQTIVALFDAGLPEPEPGTLIVPSGVENLAILPGADGLKRYDHPCPESHGPLAAVVRHFVNESKRSYDLVLIDCPPSVGLCSWNALNASDFVVVPVVPENPAAQGTADVQEFIDLVLGRVNPTLKLLGYLLTRADLGAASHRGYIEMIRQLFGADVFGAIMPELASFLPAWDARKPISHFKGKSVAARATLTVAEEMLARIGRVQTQSPRFLANRAMGA